MQAPPREKKILGPSSKSNLELEMQKSKVEDEFQAYLMKEHENTFGSYHDLYAKIHKIGEKVISPEIDLLHINHKTKTLTSYEFKFLGYKRDDANYRLIRQGLGQAILYFQFGIDRSYLVLGLPVKPNISVTAQATKTASIILALKKYSKLRCLGILVWQKAPNNRYNLRDNVHPIEGFRYPLKVHYPPNTPSQFKINRDCVFDLRFRFKEAFYEDHGLLRPRRPLKGY